MQEQAVVGASAASLLFGRADHRAAALRVHAAGGGAVRVALAPFSSPALVGASGRARAGVPAR